MVYQNRIVIDQYFAESVDDEAAVIEAFAGSLSGCSTIISFNGVRYLFSDFKKKEGYKKSTEISKEYHMYRQYYCGCVYSKRDRDREIVLRRQQEEQIL